MHALWFIQARFPRPPCWTPDHPALETAPNRPSRRPKKQNWESLKQSGSPGPSWPLQSDDSAALCQVREAREWLHVCHISLFFLVSLYTMYKERSKKVCTLVSASHTRVRAKVVEHRLDQLWQVVVVLPAPVLPRVGVVEIHWPTVSWKRRSS